MQNSVFKMPLLGTICKAVGQFPVYFISSEAGKFSVDKERQAKVEDLVMEHLNQGHYTQHCTEPYCMASYAVPE